MRTKFSENFSAILKIRGISQSQFARLYGVKQNTISQWANGKREPTFADLTRICALLDFNIDEILGYNQRSKKELLRDIIGGNQEFQKAQQELQNQMRKNGANSDEISKACEELYNMRYKEYKEIFNFED